MGIIHMRKLTLKSKIGFGHIRDLTVGEMIQRNKHRELLNIYYTLANIDFDDDVKYELSLSPSRQIYKKGKIGKDEAKFLIDQCIEEIKLDNHSFGEKVKSDERPLMSSAIKRKIMHRRNSELSKIKNRDRNQKHL